MNDMEGYMELFMVKSVELSPLSAERLDLVVGMTPVDVWRYADGLRFFLRKVPCGSVVPISKRAQNASHSKMCPERERQHYF